MCFTVNLASCDTIIFILLLFHPSQLSTSATMPELNKFSHLYANKIILAPMIRENSLPFRLLCLKLGADIVYSEEIIDHALSICERIENKQLNTVDFVNKAGRVIFRTCPEEKEKLVVQLGSNKPERALFTAKLISNDVMGVDFNFGCPKSFSLKGGMGAAMLSKPDDIKELLTTCVQNLNIPVTCKIRVLPSLEKTLELVKMIESCGVAALAVHGRTKDQRSDCECQVNYIKAIRDCLSIPVIANGGSNCIKTYDDILRFKELTGASSVMIARAAMKNPSIFSEDRLLKPIETIIPEFLKLAVKYENYLPNTRYAIQAMMSTSVYGNGFLNSFHHIKDVESICKLFDLEDWYRNVSNNDKLISNQDKTEVSV